MRLIKNEGKLIAIQKQPDEKNMTPEKRHADILSLAAGMVTSKEFFGKELTLQDQTKTAARTKPS